MSPNTKILTNMKRSRAQLFFTLTLVTSLNSFAATPARISVNTSSPGHVIPPTLWGVFFEDINLSADGGIYPELVRNRSFEDADKPDSWKFTAPDGNSAATIATPTKAPQ